MQFSIKPGKSFIVIVIWKGSIHGPRPFLATLANQKFLILEKPIGILQFLLKFYKADEKICPYLKKGFRSNQKNSNLSR